MKADSDCTSPLIFPNSENDQGDIFHDSPRGAFCDDPSYLCGTCLDDGLKCERLYNLNFNCEIYPVSIDETSCTPEVSIFDGPIEQNYAVRENYLKAVEDWDRGIGTVFCTASCSRLVELDITCEECPIDGCTTGAESADMFCDQKSGKIF